jgi:uncharacterized protein YdhG (YjbR/CyaY superfamily)
VDVDDYIRSQPGEVQQILEEIRRRIHKAVPGTGEKISYQMPTFTLGDRFFVYVAAWKKHISVYPIPEGMDEELEPYRAARGTLKFVLAKPIPFGLIAKVAKLLAEQLAGSGR